MIPGTSFLFLSLFSGLAALCCLFLFKSYIKLTRIFIFLSLFNLINAFCLILYFLLDNNFNINYVYSHSAIQLAVIYKISALWAGQEGSLLLWTIFFIPFIVFFSIINKDNFILKIVLSIYIFYIFIIIFYLNPFIEINSTKTIANGIGLKPVLKNFWMISHPPLLFLGYTFTLIPFAFAIKAFCKNNYNNWHENAYPFIVGSFLFISAGIFSGAYWAYTVLGWGGFWGWDPVENSSLIPWLFSIALIHGIYIQKRSNQFRLFNLLIAIILFELILLSTFLTRSGLLSDFSVHTFGYSNVTIPLLFLIVFIAVTTSLLIIYKFSTFKKFLIEHKSVKNSDSFTIFATIGLILYAFKIIIATLLPIISTHIFNFPASLTAKFYNTISLPFGIFFLLALLFAQQSSYWQKNNFKKILLLLLLSLICTHIFNINYSKSLISYSFSFISFYIIIFSLYTLTFKTDKINKSSYFCHLGTAILILGIISSAYQSSSKEINCKKNETIKTNYGNFTYKDFSKNKILFSYNINKNETNFSFKYHQHENKSNEVLEPYIKRNLLYDLYITPTSLITYEKNKTNSSKKTSLVPDIVILNIDIKRFISLVWLGSFLIILGAIFSFKNIVKSNRRNNII